MAYLRLLRNHQMSSNRISVEYENDIEKFVQFIQQNTTKC